MTKLKFLGVVLSSLIVLSFCPTSLSSSSNDLSLRSKITHPITKKLKEKLKKERAKKAKKAEEFFKKHNKLRRSSLALTFTPLSPLSLLETSLHSISGVFPKDNSLEIENSSGFSMNSADMAIASKWQTNAIIKITPNHSWFSSYEYCITNVQTKEIVQVNLTRGPLENSPYNKRIVDININSGLVLLDNGSYYQVSNSVAEQEAISKWEIGDVIIIGDNDSWFSFGYSSILINIAAAHYVTACHIDE